MANVIAVFKVFDKIIKIKPETKWSKCEQKLKRSNSSMLQNTEMTCI